MEASELNRLLQEGADVLLVDVRTEQEYRGRLGHIPEAIHVPLPQLYAGRFSFPRGKPVIFICRRGVRSLDAARYAARRGYTAYSVEGGMLAWRSLKPEGEGVRFRFLDGGEGC